MKNLPVALQVYSIRDEAERDFRAAMEKVKEIGYDGVELAGLYNLAPSTVKAILEEFDLVPLSAHVPYDEMVEDIDKVIRDYSEIGCKYLVIPYMNDDMRPNTPKFPEVISEITRIGSVCKENGITLLYHNHDFEFVRMPDGSYGLDYLYANVPADFLQTEIDTCWVKVAGEDPAAYVEKYTGRSPIVHLKDFYMEGRPSNLYQLIGIESTKEEEESGIFEFRPVGHGVQDMPSILDASLKAGAKWVVVEQDESEGRTPLEAVELSRKYLKSLGW
ncbi:MAG: sugar phosphate isomerase/epimerase [Clostridiales bacterium]|jgi:sugar phosphate isomerase/epimerase|nr:sugar phosphate isomerase/epimerase [Clostridiales bacterium]